MPWSYAALRRRARPCGQPLDSLVHGLFLCQGDHPVDIYAGQVHRIRLDLPGFNEVLYLGDSDLACHGADRVEVACGPAEDQVPVAVTLPGARDSEISRQSTLEHVGPALELCLRLRRGGDC